MRSRGTASTRGGPRRGGRPFIRATLPTTLLVALSACIATAPGGVGPSGTLSAAGSQLVVPARIGDLSLMARRVPLTGNDILGEIVIAAGGDPSAVDHLEVLSGDTVLFDLFLASAVRPDAFAEAARAALMSRAAARTSTPLEGWLVWQFDRPGGGRVLRVAAHDGRIILFHLDTGLDGPGVQAVLAGLR